MRYQPWWLLATLLNVSVIAPAFGQVTYTPQPIAFGAVKLGATSATLSSTLTNTGTDTLKFCGGATLPAACTGRSTMTGSAAFQYVTDNCTARPPGTSCVLQYRFAPKTVGALVGANVVQTNHGPFPLQFTGMGLDTVTAPPPPVSVARVLLNVAGTIPLTLPGGTWQSFATPVDSAGRTLTRPVTWHASAPAVATVDSTGFVRALSPGLDTITASAGGQSAFFLVVAALPPDTTTVFLSVGGVWVANLPSHWRTTFPTLPLATGRYLIALLNPAGTDTVGWFLGSVTVAKPAVVAP